MTQAMMEPSRNGEGRWSNGTTTERGQVHKSQHIQMSKSSQSLETLIAVASGSKRCQQLCGFRAIGFLCVCVGLSLIIFGSHVSNLYLSLASVQYIYKLSVKDGGKIPPLTSPSPLLSLSPSSPSPTSAAIEAQRSKVADLTCKFPILDPFDPSIMSYVYHYYGLECKQLQANLSYVDYYNYLWLNQTELARVEKEKQENPEKPGRNRTLSCQYRTFDRANGTDDNAVKYDSALPLVPGKPEPIGKDFVEVTCSWLANSSKLLIYYNLHPLAANGSRKAEFGKESEQQLSVLMFMIDSMSLSLLIRNLPLTFAFLNATMKTSFLRGFNKIADNSFVNMMPWLTGKRVYEGEPGMPGELDKEDLSRIQYDHWPFIWKDYAKKGYVTSYNEDTPIWGTFHYGARGFANKFVDHTYRPFWYTSALDKNIQKNSSDFCFGNVPKPWFQVDIMRRQFLTYPGTLKFGFNFFTELIHDYYGNIDRADALFRDFLKEMHDGGHLNKTVVVFGSDHGHRFSGLRATLIGLIEERMPAFSFYFPPWFLQKHPNIRQNLATNEYRLTANFDVYETLKDILAGNYNGSQRPLSSRGLSLMYEVPANRTCQAAGIPQQYCTCSESRQIGTKETLAVEAGKFLIGYINEIIGKFANLCQKLSVKGLLHAELFEMNQKVIQGIKHHKDGNNLTHKDSELKMLRVSLEATPGDAKFEAMVVFNNRSNVFSLQGGPNDISRLNMYGNQSACLPESAKVQRKLCYCKNI